MEVMINTCYGGFSFSKEAIVKWAQSTGKSVWTNVGKLQSMTEYWTVPPSDPRRVALAQTNFAELDHNERLAYNVLYKSISFDPQISRADEKMIEIVKELGEKSWGRYSEIYIVEIPDDVEWVIEEHDGYEHIAEKHRTWR